MKAILKFDLPDDHYLHLQAVHALDMALVLWDYDQWLRGQVKYGDDNHRMEILEEAREQLRDIMSGHGVDLDALNE
jgi:hypothetical protein